jgi:natural product biosynthesis luciferase-like monooxygenase protein
VLVEHRHVVNLFAAMDSIVQRCSDETWLAVTSLSFDISVLELLYTLARGIRIAIHTSTMDPTLPRAKAMDFSLFYFSADEAENAKTPDGKYRLLLDGARFADANGFCAVWTPERHFHAFGGLYPNPAVTAAAIAAITERVGIRAGAVVLPLHHPIEIAEAWSMVDNLSNGRVGVAFAAGWHPNDFVLRPQNYVHAKTTMFEGVDQIQRLWRGETLAFHGPDTKMVEVATLPRPVQPALPTWITTAGDPESFAAAGSLGANLLTHLVGQSIDQLAVKIAAYRAARSAAGHDPSTGVVTLMLHTFVGDDEHAVRSIVREPLRNYLSTSFNLVREHAWSFPTFRRPDGAPVVSPDDLADDDIAELAGEGLDAVLDFAAQRYYETSGLFGTPDQVLPLVERLHDLGVDEIACLIDFGVATDTVLAHLPQLALVREMVAARAASNDDMSIADLATATSATHLQCTPSMARMFTLDPAMRAALGKIHHLLVGGEALPPDLAHELHALVGGTVSNMYGPTETTVWSTAWTVQNEFDWTSIGTPIANTQVYVLDNAGQPTPPGVAGQLWIGGAGVARGYHQRPDLTAERFRPNPFRDRGNIYCTGDIARWRQQPGGSAALEFLGRSDQQVKLRGHRIELGEIEAELLRLDGVIDGAAVIRNRGDDPLDQQLLAYVVVSDAAFDPSAARKVLRRRLPEVMVPSHVAVLTALPRTPNGKVDRRSLAALAPTSRAMISKERPPPASASSDIERLVLACWCQVLATDTLGIDDNFFDVGGHSLLIVRLQRLVQERLGESIALTDLYRFPTVRTFSASLDGNVQTSAAIEGALDRAARRRATARGRR